MVAELSANHQQDLGTALRTIEAAAAAGADAIKLQTYTPDTITMKSDSEVFRLGGGTAWDGRTLYDLYEEAFTPWEWHEELFAAAHDSGLLCFSSPFDATAVSFLESLDTPAYKVASFEIVDTPLIRDIASRGKPVIISTGIASLDETQAALDACYSVGNRQVLLLKCTSAYPARLEDANLRTMVDLADRFGVLVGLSDHTVDDISAVAAVAMGACFVEKHLTLDRSLGGPDAGFSLEPAEFAAMVSRVRATESAMGSVDYELGNDARASRKFARSLFVVRDVKQGELANESNVRSIRPSDGIAPSLLPHVMGHPFLQDVSAGTPLALSMLGISGTRGLSSATECL